MGKSTKIIPVMIMGKVLNKRTYPLIEYIEAGLISLGVSVFSLSQGTSRASAETRLLGVAMLALYIVSDSFTSQWQSKVYKNTPDADQFHMMFATNLWSI